MLCLEFKTLLLVLKSLLGKNDKMRCSSSCIDLDIFTCFIQLQYKEAEGSSYRDGSYIDMPGTPKVSQLIFYFQYHVLII